ncbi:serine hydrolase domain-containing protein [Natrarchaeobius halalkaliphilus]|nr:serine hydrolase domain-containing protein [Natrarchaeobius halalkaliphilus]
MTTDGHSSKSTVSANPTFTEIDGIESFIDAVMSKRIGTEIPGASVAIVEGSDPVLAKGYGYADMNSGTPVQADETTFEAGSVGKLVTWTAVMQGVQDGLLDLDEDVNTYLDNSDVQVPDAYEDPITLRHLGTHTSGLESALAPAVVDTPDQLTSLETVLVERRPERVRPPGKAVGYSNYGAALAGHMVAETYDTPFEEHVQSTIFEPLDMSHSTFAQPVPEERPGTLAASHRRDGSEFITAEPVYINMWPAGSMTATATDMATFMSAHLGDGSVDDTRILESDTVATMYSQHYERHPAVNNWRYGFYEYGHPDGDVIAHSGGTIYQESQLALAPQHDIGIFVNYNLRTDDEESLAVIDEILEEYNLQPDSTTPISTSESGGKQRAETVTDEYGLTMLPQNGPLKSLDSLSRVSVEAAGDGRLLSKTLDGSREWVEIDPYVYQEQDGNDVLAFDIVDGEVAAMHESSLPQNTYRSVPFHERQLVTGGVLGVSLSGFVLSILGWGGHYAYRQWRHDRTATGATTMEPSTGEPTQVTESGNDEEGCA